MTCKDEVRLGDPVWVRQRIVEIVENDLRSISFMYADVLDINDLAVHGEWWVEFSNLEWLMNSLIDGLAHPKKTEVLRFP